MTDVKHPEAAVYLGDLSGPEGNAFAILGRVSKALKDAGVSKADQDAYHEAATSGDYHNLLRVTQETLVCAVAPRTPVFVTDLAATIHYGGDEDDED